jgi:hypothetical protein
MAYATINKPSEYFNTKLYTGNSTITNAITGVGFQPDWVWLKGRTIAESHRIYDAVRGASNHISSNASVAETSTFPLTSFDSDGFTIGSADDSVNGAYNYVAWNWLADNTSGSSNTDGSITSTVSASTTSGFSIVTYTGTGSNATIGHGLGSAPSVVICKQLSGTQQWINYHNSIGATQYLHLNGTDAANTASTIWNDTEPTTSVFSVGTVANCNASGGTYVAYCFAEKKGFSKFGSYTGNGDADGTFVYTGFKPAFVIHKRTDSAGYSWLIHDNKRPDYNSTDKILEADLANAEQSNYHMDLLSNGFKHRITSGSTNASGGTYIYMAFAEEPLVGTNNIPATAR